MINLKKGNKPADAVNITYGIVHTLGVEGYFVLQNRDIASAQDAILKAELFNAQTDSRNYSAVIYREGIGYRSSSILFRVIVVTDGDKSPRLKDCEYAIETMTMEQYLLHIETAVEWLHSCNADYYLFPNQGYSYEEYAGIVYPFKEGDTYYTIEDGQVIESCWDEQSEILFSRYGITKGYYATHEEALQAITNK